MIVSGNLLLGQGRTTDILRASCSSSWRHNYKHSSKESTEQHRHTSGSSAPSMTFPTPSIILYVGNCFPSAVTALKKWGFGVMGDWEVGNRPCPWLSGKETRVVVDRHLRNMREKVNCVQVRKVRIIWKVNSELASINLARLAHTTDRRVANAGPGGKKRLARVDRTGVIVMVTLSHLIGVNFKFVVFLYCDPYRPLCLVPVPTKGLIWDYRAYSLTRLLLVTVSPIQETRHD